MGAPMPGVLLLVLGNAPKSRPTPGCSRVPAGTAYQHHICVLAGVSVAAGCPGATSLLHEMAENEHGLPP
jgi:hypothetical protein